jgi:large subunit ribosomal protein L22
MENMKIDKSTSTFKAVMRSIKISDKKIRPLTKAIKGNSIEHIIYSLSVQRIKASLFLLKLIKSAISNIPKEHRDLKNINIKNLYVDKGRSYKRIFTRSQGRVNYIRKKTSHMTIIISLKNHI